MAYSGKSIYYAKEFLRIYGEDFTEADLEEYKRISPLEAYGEIGWNGFLEALNYLVMGDDLKTKYKPVWVPDEESARKVADLYGFKRKGHVVDPGVYEGLDKYPNGKTSRAAFFRLMGYPDRHGHTFIYSNADNDKHISIVYNSKECKAVKDGVATYYYSKPYFVFEKLSNGSATEGVEDWSATDSVGPQGSKWNKYNLSDFAISKKGSPYLYATLTTGGIRGLEPRKKPVFFPHKIIDNSYVVVPNSVVREIESDTTWEVRFPSAVEQVAEEAYAVIKTAAPFGAKSFTVVGDKATAARVARIKNKTVEDDDKHTYIYRKMDEVNSEKYNIPVNEGVENMKGLVDKLLALGQETATANENYAEARPNSQRLLEQLDDYLDGKTLAEELIGWMSDDEVGRFAEEYGYFPNEGDFADEEDGEEFEAEEGLTEKEEEVLDELPPEQPVGDSQALDEEQGKPVKSATEKKSVCEGIGEVDKDSYLREAAETSWESGHPYDPDDFEYFKHVCKDDGYDVTEEDFQKYWEYFDECRERQYSGDRYGEEDDLDPLEREMFEAMNRNSITDLQASVSDSISRIGSLGTIQLLLDSELADSFQDELFFIKNTYDLSDTQLVSKAILDAGETLLEDGELEMAIETLRNSSEEENEEEFSEYEEPEDWSEVDQVEEGEVEEPVEGEPTEGEEITEEETELEEENI